MKNLNLFLLLTILCTSCSSSKFLTSGVNSNEITEMLKIEPFSYIYYIEKGNQEIFNDSLSYIAENLLSETMEKFSYKLRLSPDKIDLTDEDNLEILSKELDLLISSAVHSKKVLNISITPFIESILTDNNKRFGLIIVQNGFSRTKSNYGGQVAKAIGLGIVTGLLTGVAVYQTPVKANSTLYALIVDNQNKNVAFFNKSVLHGSEPVVRENITKQINSVFEKYLWGK